MTGPLPAGTLAPEFTLPVSADRSLSLRDLRGRPVILAFYPADGADGILRALERLPAVGRAASRP